MDPLQLIAQGAGLDAVLATAPALMAFPFAALIPAAVSLVGGLFKKKGEQKQAEGEWESKRPEWEREEATKAARSQLVSKILSGLGIGGSIDPALMSKLGTAQPFPNRPAGGWQGMVGGALSGVAPHLYRSMNPESFGGLTPASDAANSGLLYGPPRPADVNAGGGGVPFQADAETIGKAGGGNSEVDDYLKHFRGVSGASF
jgi:hypothetical protein